MPNQHMLNIYIKRLEPFAHLWKTDDKEWMTQRQKDWEIFEANNYHDYPKSELRACKNYFLKGERIDYIPAKEIILLTPVCSSSIAKEFFYSENFADSERRDLLGNCPFIFFLPDQRLKLVSDFSKYYCEGVLGDGLERLARSLKNDTTLNLFIRVSRNWCEKFVKHSLNLLTGDTRSEDLFYAVEYFSKAIQYVDEFSRYFRESDYNRFFEAIQEVLDGSTDDATVIAFAEELNKYKDEILPHWEKIVIEKKT